MTGKEKGPEIDTTAVSDRRRQIDCVGERDAPSVGSRGRGVREIRDEAERLKEMPPPPTS